MQTLVAIAVGGAAGALSRHFVASAVSKWVGPGFPYGTMTVNVLGSLLMGLLITVLAHKFEAAPELRALLTVGFLGSFTTFSTYSMETVLLMERGDIQGAALYAFGSLAIGVLALLTGMWLGRLLT